jgi:phosphatidylglycerophosphate synthase
VVTGGEAVPSGPASTTAREARGFKPDDVDEPIDRIWHRPLADRLIVVPVLPTRVTPNQLTIASGAMSLLAGGALALAASDGRLGAVGAALLLGSILIDCADGQLARRRGTSSTLGRILDGAVDAIAPTSVLAGMAVWLQRAGYEPRLVWSLAAITGASLAWHASVYDALKTIYLAAARPDFDAGGDPLASAASLCARARDHASGGDRSAAWLFRIFAFWIARQGRLLAPWRAQGARPKDAPQRAAFVARFHSTMRSARWLGFGTHLFVLTLAALTAALSPLAIVAAWLVIVGPLNAWCLIARVRWSRRERLHHAP